MPFTQRGPAEAPELGTADEKVAIAEMVRQGIRKAREKLIDLSLRNGMLNYRHSESSSRHIRVVHQLPGAVVECLASEKSIDLLPLPPVETIPRDEETDDFRAELKEAKAVDPEWLAAEDAKRAAGSRRRSKDRAAERSLRDRVRKQLGMPEWQAATDPKVRAQELGIDPSYDLKDGPKGGDVAAGQPKIQTLFFPDRLEPKLSAIHSAARTLQEDAGISALSCAVGFLEWYETDDGPTPAYAPLLLLPINMEKRVAGGEYVFSIVGRDDDETTNVALREKLRQHGIELPEYDPEEGAEYYLASVTEAVRNRPRWRVRRWVTIGIFSFSRQAMWTDLDPERWPAAARPDGHALLQQIYGDAPVGELNTLAPVHDIDHPDVELQAPVLVTDADASQVSAVIDVAGGTSLVIQGPPGTGKSQTITNVIANAMWQGKSILFVSEKMAALGVVKDRLDHMGLGLFCLEVHSAKASKAQVLHALKERMDAGRIRSNAEEIERARTALQQARQRLTDYAGVMNAPAGDTGLTTHDILWGDASRAVLPNGVPLAAVEFRFPDPVSIDRFKLRELKSAGKALDDQADAMGAFAEPVRQPWRGVGNLNITRFDRASAIEEVTEWSAALDWLLQAVRAIRAATQWEGIENIEAARQTCQRVRTLPPLEAEIDPALLSLTLEPPSAHALSRWAELVLSTLQLEALIDETCERERLSSQLNDVQDLVERAEALGVQDAILAELKARHTESRARADELARAIALMRQVLSVTDRDPGADLDIRAEALAASFLRNVQAFPHAKAHLRSARLAEDGVLEDIGVAQDLATNAAAAASEAQFGEAPTSAFAASLPAPRDMRAAAVSIKHTSWVGKLFSGDWRRAKATWRQAFPAERSVSASSAARLVAAAKWKEGLDALEGCVNAKDAIGRNWRGIATPFADIGAVAEWMRAVQKVTPLAVPGARALRRLLFEGPSGDIHSLADAASGADAIDLIGIFSACYTKQSSVSQEARSEFERASQLEALLRKVDASGLRPGIAVGRLNEAATSLRKALECRAALATPTVVTHAIGATSAENEAARARTIRATLDRAKDVARGGLPSSVVKWLLHPDHASRIETLSEMAVTVERAIEAEAPVRERADGLLHIDPIDWCGGTFTAVPIERLVDKALRAAQAPDDLEKQITLLATEDEARRLGLGDLIAVWSKEGLRYQGVAWTVEAAFFRSVAAHLMREQPALMRHTGSTHEQVRKRFQELDKEILSLNRRLVAAKVFTRPIPVGQRAQSTRDYTDNQMLDHQTSLQKPRIALRRLFGNAGAAIRAYKPCIMMSPMSVAQYLEPGKHRFDLLIIDEASQMRPEDALGALIRCTQAVVVGDPEQLPPSDFFVAAESRDDEEIEDSPEESILELGRRCWRPMRMLGVHYRSRHQSLIAYSNREFYDDRLLVYPSPFLDDPDFGVTCQKVADGGYEAGQGRNSEEARAIVAEAASHMRKRIARSIGIVAVNKAQSELIETLMDELAASDPEIQAYRQHWDGTLEAFFVKNLENVQGDERDIILVSTVYGKTAEGVFHQNFGPINKAYGHRRLNVLFTRAKRRLALFTSLDPSQIVPEGKQRGVRVLKEFLEYAASGTIQHGRQTGQEPDSDFERWFLSRLKSAGYIAHPQVGVAQYRIDIGIVHPDKPGSYIVGLECDGATYHSSKSARDRDRLRQSVLEELNWRIHRVWSTDWYRDPEREFNRLTQKIESLREIAEPETAAHASS
jgi:very-short-patch-repair endonuclease